MGWGAAGEKYSYPLKQGNNLKGVEIKVLDDYLKLSLNLFNCECNCVKPCKTW